MAERDPNGFKESEFNFFVTALSGDCVLFFNTRTGAFRTLGRPDWERVQAALEDLDAPRPAALDAMMRETGMIVPHGRDERSELERAYLGAKKPRGLTLTITPTISCNFGCHYCFQSHSKERMRDRDEAAILAFVDQRLPADTHLTVTWFGGEPLTHLPFIATLSERLAVLAEARGCRYGHSMVTNGFLLNARVLETIAGMRPLSYVQVTLDGGREAHDRRRALLSGRGTYDVILRNIEAAAGRFPIHIRVNVDRSNVHSIEPLIDDYFARGLHQRGVHVYLAHTRPYTEHSKGIDSDELSKAEYADLSLKFDLYMFQRGMTGAARLPKPRAGTICTADTENAYVISPGGKLFKCWNDAANTDPEMVAGLIAQDGTVAARADHTDPWEGHNPYHYKACRTCKVQPLCKGGCPWEAKKHEDNSIGDCSVYRWNLPDRLRLYHMQETLRRTTVSAA